MKPTRFSRRLEQQPGVQLIPLPLSVEEVIASITDRNDQVFAAVARLTRGRIDQPMLLLRSEFMRRTGAKESNLVSPLNEPKMQVAEALNAGARGAVVMRLVPAGVAKRYAQVFLGDVIQYVALTGNKNAVTIHVKVVDFVENQGAMVDFVARVSVSGVQGGRFTILVPDAFYGVGMRLNGSDLLIKNGVRNFQLMMVPPPGAFLFGVITVSVGNASAGIEINPSATVVSVNSSGGPSVNEGASAVFVVGMDLPYGAEEVPVRIYGTTSPPDIGVVEFGGGVTATPGLEDGVFAVLLIPAGVVSFTITVPLVADELTEGDETLSIMVGDVTSGVQVLDTSLSPPADITQAPVYVVISLPPLVYVTQAPVYLLHKPPAGLTVTQVPVFVVIKI